MLSIAPRPQLVRWGLHGATYKLARDPDPVDGDAPKLTGSVIGYYFDPTGASIVVQPAAAEMPP